MMSASATQGGHNHHYEIGPEIPYLGPHLLLEALSRLRGIKFLSPAFTLGQKNASPQNTGNDLMSSQNVEVTHNCGSDFRVHT